VAGAADRAPRHRRQGSRQSPAPTISTTPAPRPGAFPPMESSCPQPQARPHGPAPAGLLIIVSESWISCGNPRAEPGAPIPKFASTRGTSDANFGIKRGTSNFMILVRFLNLKFLHELAAPNDRNFKFTALDCRRSGRLPGNLPASPIRTVVTRTSALNRRRHHLRRPRCPCVANAPVARQS
jgi:hypothetical protein